MGGTLGALRPVVLARGVVRQDGLDRVAFADMAERAPRFGATVGAAPQVPGPGDGEAAPYGEWESLVRDAFAVFHQQAEPTLRAPDEVRASVRLHHRLIEQLLVRDETVAARAYTRSRELESALATMAAVDGLRGALDGALREDMERAARIASLEAERDAAAFAEEEAVRDGVAQEERQARAARRAQAEAALSQATREQAEDLGKGEVIRRAVDEAARRASEDAKVVGRLPGLGEGERRRIPLDQQIALATRWVGCPTLRRVAELSGRLVRDMQGARARRVRGGREVAVEVVQGDDMAALLAHEMMALRHPQLRREALCRMADRELLVWEMEGEERGARGPIVAVVDSSGSMAGARIVWAKAVCLALITLARRERRHAAAVEYASGRPPVVYEFAPRRLDLALLAQMAEAHLGGGTATGVAMAEAARLMGEAPPFRQADIVLVSDGIDTFGEGDRAVRDALRAAGVRVQGVAVEREPTAYLNLMCDTVVSVYDLEGPSVATRAVATHITPP